MNGLTHITPTLLQRQRRLLPLDNRFFLLQMPRTGRRTSKILSFNYLRPLRPSLSHLKKSHTRSPRQFPVDTAVFQAVIYKLDAWKAQIPRFSAASDSEGVAWGLGNCSVSQVCESTFKRMSRALHLLPCLLLMVGRSDTFMLSFPCLLLWEWWI